MVDDDDDDDVAFLRQSIAVWVNGGLGSLGGVVGVSWEDVDVLQQSWARPGGVRSRPGAFGAARSRWEPPCEPGAPWATRMEGAPRRN